MLVEDCKWLGYSRIILKSDNEVAIVRLLTESLKELRVSVGDLGQVMEEHPPPFDSQANGDAESAAKAIRGQVRTMQSFLEGRLGHRIPMQHPLMSWMIEHAAALITNRVRGHDGKTAYSRVRGRPFGTRLLAFGEKCKFKLRSKESPNTYLNGRRFHTGIFGWCLQT